VQRYFANHFIVNIQEHKRAGRLTGDALERENKRKSCPSRMTYPARARNLS
jgi:hypothetical protein